MPKRKQVTLPVITDELLVEAEEVFFHGTNYDELRAKLFNSGETKKRYHKVGKAITDLRNAWKALDDEERCLFFESVNAPSDATRLLLGDEKVTLHDIPSRAPSAEERLDSAFSGYMAYKEFSSLRGAPVKFRNSNLIEFLMEHWEKETGSPAVYYRNNSKANTGRNPLLAWIMKCLAEMEKRGVKDLKIAQAESVVENTYKKMRKKRP
ncbi:MAG: hypothetical protein P8P30_10155 [Rickettsiales bacterium]|nr:hypothetical protein [Rickettsiales bacterium]